MYRLAGVPNLKTASNIALTALKGSVVAGRSSKPNFILSRERNFTTEDIDMTDLSMPEARAKLREQFIKFGGEKYGEGWDDLWNKGDFLPWDRGLPSPAFVEALKEHSHIIGNALTEVDGKPQRKKALVPGCGRGVDVCLLESFGYDAIGLEFSQKAVDECEKYAKEHGSEYPVRDEKTGKGSKKFLRGDFYRDDWLDETGLGAKHFDLIYDYTVGLLPPQLTFPL